MSEPYSLAEMMCVQAARELRGAGMTFIGMGLPLLSATLAKLMHDRDLAFSTEVGVVDWDPPPEVVDHAPAGIGDPILNRGAAFIGDMVDALGSLAMGGRVDTAVLTGAEVDRYGNLNTMIIGDPVEPEARFPGAGGNTDAACAARRVFVMMSLEPRRVVERVSFRTSPGYIDGPGAREAAGLDVQGPNLVITTMGVFDFDTPDGGRSGSCEMRLRSVYVGGSAETVAALLPWPLRVAPDVDVCEPPSAEELDLLRRLDPAHSFLGDGRY